MRKALLLIALLLNAPVFLTLAQDKMFSANDYLNPALRPKDIAGLSWQGEKDLYTWVENNCLIQKSAENPAVPDTLVTLDLLNTKMNSQRASALRRFPFVTWSDGNRFFFTNENRVWLFDLSDTSLTMANEFDSAAEISLIDRKSLNVAWTVGNNLFVATGGQTLQVTDEKNDAIVHGQVPSRNEFGISKGMYWSPDGKLLAFYRTDQSDVSDYPLVDIDNRIAVASPVKYPMAGMKSQKVSLGIFNTALNEIVYLQIPGPENQYITSVTWDPSGEYIYAGILNRDQDHLLLNKYESSTGKMVKTLFEEKNSRYVEPQGGLYFPGDGGSEFIWQSRRDGWNHLYLYTT